MTDTTIDAGKMTKDELSRWLELHLFQNDLAAKTDEQIGETVANKFSVWNPNTSPDYYCVKMSFGGGESFDAQAPKSVRVLSVYPARSVGYWLWQHRKGKTWQSPLEAHVAAFRFPPRDLAGTADGMMLVLGAMREKGFAATLWTKISLSSVPGPGCYFGRGVYPPDRDGSKHKAVGGWVGGSLIECVARAAVAALTESEAANG